MRVDVSELTPAMPARRQDRSRFPRRRRPTGPAAYRRLIRAAEVARGKAYAPYSQFPVGAAALAADGTIYAGCNVENASLGLTQCAERVAIHCAVAGGRRRLVAVAVAGPSGISPCGACRQVMDEFGVETVILSSPGEPPAVVALRDLLPRPFARGILRSRPRRV
jgi:cytidine deaminase